MDYLKMPYDDKFYGKDEEGNLLEKKNASKQEEADEFLKEIKEELAKLREYLKKQLLE